MDEQENDETEHDDPRLGRCERGAAARGDCREEGEHAEQDQRGIAREQHQGRGNAEPIPGASAVLHHRAPVVQQHQGPQRHGQDWRAEIRRRHGEQRNSRHQEHRHDGVRRTGDRATEREDAPIGRHHANLRQQVNAEHAGAAEGNLGQPISERRTDTGIEAEFMADGEKLGQVARRGCIKQHRHNEPHQRLRERRRPEHQARARAQHFDVDRYVKH